MPPFRGVLWDLQKLANGIETLAITLFENQGCLPEHFQQMSLAANVEHEELG